MKGFAAAGALLFALSFTTPAMAADGGALTTEAAATLTPNGYVWRDTSQAGDIRIVISIADQRAYVYRDSSLIAVSAVSTGMEGKETPAGIYPILQKNKDHRSNLYNAAPMPFMQRLTWDGIAIHAGRNPGFPASHGCIRVPTAFAAKLFAITQVGTEVEVTEAPVMDGLSDDVTTPEDTAPLPEVAEKARANGLQLASFGRR